MNFPFTTIGMNPPPPRRAAPVPNPATVPASLPSSRMAARDRAQSWRGKYLRALNICSEDTELARRLAAQKASTTTISTTTTTNGKSRLRALNFHRTDFLDHHALSRSYSSSTEKEEEERKSRERATQHQQRAHRRAGPQQHQIHAVPLRAPSTTIGVSASSMATPMGMPMAPTAANPYGFPMRANIARGRRCHTDPFTLQERGSAPIQIPSNVSGNNQFDGHGRNFESRVSGFGLRGRASPQSIRTDSVVVATTSNNHTTSTTHVRLLSWEEPVAMVKAADAVSRGWHMPMGSMELGLRRGRDVDVEEDLHLDRMNDEDDDDDVDSLGGDIFEMDESDDDATQNNQPSRRRFRTESMNIVTSGREKRTHRTFHDEGYGQDGVFGGHGRGADLSQSFVPPHQLVDRSDCFSIGLRDEFKKRRPINHI